MLDSAMPTANTTRSNLAAFSTSFDPVKSFMNLSPNYSLKPKANTCFQQGIEQVAETLFSDRSGSDYPSLLVYCCPQTAFTGIDFFGALPTGKDGGRPGMEIACCVMGSGGSI